MPQKEKVLEFLRSMREWLKNHKQASPASVIGYLNPRIVGWSNYYKGLVSKETFSYVKSQIWQQLWRWCLRRHSTKKRTWVKKKYFIAQRGKDWIFHSYTTLSNGNRKLICLRDMSETPIQRHIKVKGKASPDDAQLQLYWEKRKYAKTFAELKSWRLDLMASKQDWRCPQCSEFLADDFSRCDSGQVSFVPIRRTKENVLVHSECAGTLERNMET